VSLRRPHQLPEVRRFDDAVERGLDHWRGRPVVDRLLYGASEAGNFSLIWHAAAWAPWLVAPNASRLRRASEVSALLAVESVLVNGPVKAMFRRNRPDNQALHPHRLRRPRTSSFPSGHASAAMVGAALLGRDRPPVAVAAYAAAALVSTSRVYVRIHHASDVAGGLVIGWALGRAFRRLPLVGRPRRRPPEAA
jgi:undecaprenyl-diphosphatase